MLPPLLVGLAVSVGNVVGSATAAILTVHLAARMLRHTSGRVPLWKGVATLAATVLIATVAAVVQIALWALTFMACGEFDAFDRAFYHSAVNFATLGYGDVVMSERWRLLGPLEAINGVLLLGFATAQSFAVMSRLMAARIKELQAKAGE
jgi:hypothetical protein